MRRRLVLRTERLTELRAEELVLVAGAAAPTLPLDECFVAPSQAVACDSLLRPCISHTCTR